MTQYVGIADANGLESFISVPETSLEAELEGKNGSATMSSYIGAMAIRVRANRHRHAVCYRVEIDESDAAAVKWLMEAGRYVEALEKLKKYAKKVELIKQGCGNVEKSWEMIPNKDLDPY